VSPNTPKTNAPICEWVDPATLLVHPVYQRDLSKRSINLIRKIVNGWDWAKFKPPVVASTGEGFEVIDGQHTAIAAATHPAIEKIPVMVVTAHEVADRARAFVGHNTDRLNLSPAQLHYASVAAEDDDALTVHQVCKRAGVELVRYPPANGEWRPGQTLAVAAIRTLVARRGAMGARIVLQVLVEAGEAPMRANGIKAVEMLLYDPEYKSQVSASDLASTIAALGPRAIHDPRTFAATHNVPKWKGLASILFREARRGRRHGG
jgi:hypothetical protein